MDSNVKSWAEKNILESIHVDCSTAVMLKILDGKCKMDDVEKRVMASLYTATKHMTGSLFDGAIHELINLARQGSNEKMKMEIYEKRVLAETMISRPVMKKFKSMIREKGLFNLRILQ